MGGDIESPLGNYRSIARFLDFGKPNPKPGWGGGQIFAKATFPCPRDFPAHNIRYPAGVAKWQTRQTQNLFYASKWGFKSLHRHAPHRSTAERVQER